MAMPETSRFALPLLFHIAALSNSLFADYYFANHVFLPTDGHFSAFHKMGGRYNFLTVWNLTIQGVFFAICIANDIIGTNDLEPCNRPLIRTIADYLFGALVFPLGMFIGGIFWFIWLIDRNLVFPSSVDQYMPSWFNHQMHTIVIINVLGQLFLCYNKHPRSLKAIHCLISMYVSWLFFVHVAGDVWVYPVLIILPWPLKILFIASAVVGVYGTYFMTIHVHRFVWDKTLQENKITRLEKVEKTK